ncbi:MAG: 7-cyano-7-deazaguanine synthase QueC [Nitrospiraceae bacterium]|jgi:7-cyano-7-deazaguanine synthase|nr:7-cyano-7-deazaguanine synthase QueC [Nitrospiraceae bacterium]|tara:strand:+ start:228 stop:926 length:699 start_codon:yes stop_codon:yes gene_type:complete
MSTADATQAVVLTSGGLDSTVTTAIAMADGYECHCLILNYGQRHEIEIAHAQQVATSLKTASSLVLDVDLRTISRSALTTSIPVPKGRTVERIGQGIPSTYVPGRNTIFLSLALAWAESLGASAIFFGANMLDYAGYPDCRPEFVMAFNALARLGTQQGIEGSPITVYAPLLQLTKAEIILKGIELGVPFSLTHSCYDPSPQGKPCGECDSCLLRQKGFHEAGIPDPALEAR